MRRLAVIAVLALAPAAHAELVSSGPVQLRTRGDVVLGDTTQIALTLQPVAARLVVNVGTIVFTARGTEAMLRLPDARHPQVAIVAALDEHGVVIDWLAIPLAGKARVNVETARDASVVVNVAGRDAPVVRADRRGRALVPIVVPPGVDTATAIATAKNGNVTEKTLALGVRPFSRTLAVCGTRATVLAVEPDGSPSNAAPAVSVGTGVASTPRRHAPGWFEVDLTADGDAVELAAGHDLPSHCTLTMPPEAPLRARLVADRARHVAGDDALALRVELDYPGRRRHLVPAIEIAADFGTIERVDDGARWSVPAELARRTTARARLVATWPGGRLEHAIDIVLAPASPARVIVASPPALRADGESTTEIIAHVVDRFGNATTARLRARARGAVGAFVRRPDGSLVARYTAPLARMAGDDRITVVDASGVETGVRIPLEPLPRSFAAGVRAGVLSSGGRIAPLLAFTAERRLPVLGERLSLGVDAGAYRATFDATAATSAMELSERVTGSIAAAPLLARVALRERWRGVEAWLAGGAGIAIISTRIESASAGSLTEVHMAPAAAAFAGASYRWSWGTLGAELGYLHATLPSDAAVTGSAGGITTTIGYRLEL